MTMILTNDGEYYIYDIVVDSYSYIVQLEGNMFRWQFNAS